MRNCNTLHFCAHGAYTDHAYFIHDKSFSYFIHDKRNSLVNHENECAQPIYGYKYDSVLAKRQRVLDTIYMEQIV